MWRAVGNLALAAALVLAVTPPATAQAPSDSQAPSPHIGAPVLTTSAVFTASLQRIFRGSATWRAALDAVRTTGRRVLVVTPDDPIAARAASGTNRDAFDPTALAEVVPVLGENADLRFVVVVVNLPLVQRLHDQRQSPPRDFEADVDRILVHEIYGHAIPYLLAGDLSGRCADPKGGERATEACSIRRENTVRAELGLGRRTDEGINSLSLAWGRLF